MQINVSAGSVPSGGADDDDDDVPELVEDFEAASKTETGECKMQKFLLYTENELPWWLVIATYKTYYING